MRPRATFLKRDREMKLKQKAVEKAAREAARQNDGNVGKGPPIDWAAMNENTGTTPDETDPSVRHLLAPLKHPDAVPITRMFGDAGDSPGARSPAPTRRNPCNPQNPYPPSTEWTARDERTADSDSSPC